MKVVLTVVDLDEVPTKGNVDPVSEFDAISCKFSQYRKWRKRRRLKLAGERHAWEWIDFKNKEEARKAGKRFGRLCKKYGISTFYANAEAAWAGTGRSPKTVDPYGNMCEFITHFRAYAPKGTKLAYNGFSWGTTSDGRRLHNASLIKNFDIWCPMVYGTSRKTISRFFESKVYKYKSLTLERYAMVGVGRVDDRGRQWGFWTSGEGNFPGLRDLLKQVKLDGLCYFFGNGARDTMFNKTVNEPPLMHQLYEIKRIVEDYHGNAV